MVVKGIPTIGLVGKTIKVPVSTAYGGEDAEVLER